MILPDEILYLIFKQLNKKQLLICQHVCRAWKIPAQRSFLNDTVVAKVDRFIDFIVTTSANSRHAIKKITFAKSTETETLPIHLIQRILLNLPNIEEILLKDNLIHFRELGRLAPIMKLECPKLKQVVVKKFKNYMPHDDYFDSLLLFKNIQTRLTLKKDQYTQKYGGPLEYTKNFKRLQSLDTCKSSLYKSFPSLLPLFEQLTQFTELKCRFEGTAAEEHIDTLEESLIKRLSQLETFHLQDYTCAPETAQFISQYLTGLNDLKIENYVSGHTWIDQQAEAYCETLLIYTRNIPKYEIVFRQLSNEGYTRSFPLILHNTYNQDSSNNTFNLLLHTNYDNEMTFLPDGSFDISVKPQSISVYCASLLDASAIVLLDVIPDGLANVNTLNFVAKSLVSWFPVLFTVLDRLPFLTRVTARMPSFFHSNTNRYPRVTHLQLDYIEHPYEISPFIKHFPSIKYLKLSYFLKTKIILEEHDLERLTLDVSQIEKAITYFVIKIHLLRRDKQYLYKVNLDSLDVHELKGDTGYRKVKICLLNLEYLNIQKSLNDVVTIQSKISFV